MSPDPETNIPLLVVLAFVLVTDPIFKDPPEAFDIVIFVLLRKLDPILQPPIVPLLELIDPLILALEAVRLPVELTRNVFLIDKP